MSMTPTKSALAELDVVALTLISPPGDTIAFAVTPVVKAGDKLTTPFAILSASVDVVAFVEMLDVALAILSPSTAVVNVPAGTYQIGTATPLYYGTYGTSAGFTITFTLKKLSDSSQLFSETVAATSFYFRSYNWYYVVTFASSTEVYVETTIRNNTTDTFGHTPLLINRLA